MSMKVADIRRRKMRRANSIIAVVQDHPLTVDWRSRARRPARPGPVCLTAAVCHRRFLRERCGVAGRGLTLYTALLNIEFNFMIHDTVTIITTLICPSDDSQRCYILQLSLLTNTLQIFQPAQRPLSPPPPKYIRGIAKNDGIHMLKISTTAKVPSAEAGGTCRLVSELVCRRNVHTFRWQLARWMHLSTLLRSCHHVSESSCRAEFNWWQAWGEIKLKGLLGGPLLVGGLGPLAPCPPPKSGPVVLSANRSGCRRNVHEACHSRGVTACLHNVALYLSSDRPPLDGSTGRGSKAALGVRPTDEHHAARIDVSPQSTPVQFLSFINVLDTA